MKPKVLVGPNARTGILFHEGSKFGYVICQSGSFPHGVTIDKITLGEIASYWKKDDNYLPAKAALHYLHHAEYHGITRNALTELENIMSAFIIKEGGVEVFKTRKLAMAALEAAPHDAELDLVETGADLDEYTLSSLTTMYNSIVPDEQKVKKFGRKSEAIEGVLSSLAAIEHANKKASRAKPAASRASPTPADGDKPKGQKAEGGAPGRKREGSKIQIAVDLLRKGPQDEQTLLDATGYDSRNMRTAFSILKNPTRTKEVVTINYDRETKKFSMAA